VSNRMMVRVLACLMFLSGCSRDGKDAERIETRNELYFCVMFIDIQESQLGELAPTSMPELVDWLAEASPYMDWEDFLFRLDVESRVIRDAWKRPVEVMENPGKNPGTPYVFLLTWAGWRG